MARPIIGVLGGSGLYDLEGLTHLEEIQVETPFGEPSDVIMRGEYGGATLCFLPRHGRGHRFLPHEINYRANIYALKKLGVDKIISISAVGSMKEEMEPGHIVIPDQFFDRTYRRISSFFGEGCVAHVSFGDPVCPDLADVLYRSAEKTGTPVHKGGTYLNMEGPQFSTRGESNIYRSWGVSVIGMTNVTEAKLAREAEIAYSTVAMVTDYDCWHEEEVSVEAVLAILKQNVAAAKQVIRFAVEELVANPFTSRFANAMEGAIMTAPDRIPAQTREKLDLLIGKYL
jgi:5'-methylthioadenosine phosphorylase